jgi:predicted signal transduction protein with EAL and GGDEF domain
LLKETAQRLRSALRETDVLARLGGDEFAIVQQGDPDQRGGAAALAARIVSIISRPYDIDGNSVSVGASIGIALAPGDADEGIELLKMADLALYATKSAGRNGFRFFDAAMLADTDNRRQLEAELRTAIPGGEFELHYQPLVDVRTRRPAGFEALVRWRSPTRGLVMPDQFIPLAEETGLIVPLGAWILQQACADAAKWPSHLKIAVNLSPVQLAQPDLLQIVSCALAESALAPERLELEITETALFRGDVDYVTLVRRLKKLGVSIALDDFGTGYSSLSYLTMFPFDKIKIDRSFILNMTTRADCAAIVAAVLALGRSLETETVAEGVETEQQFQILRAAGVTYAQGYLFGRARPASDLVLDDAGAGELVESAA